MRTSRAYTAFSRSTALEPGADPYDFIFASYVLEHVADVQSILETVRRSMRPSSLPFAVVPNARALSRQLALEMGLIDGLKPLTEKDVDHGHRRVFDRHAINKALGDGGFEVVSEGGILLKILADFQLDHLLAIKLLTQEHVEGLCRLGLMYPDFADSLYAVARPRR